LESILIDFRRKSFFTIIIKQNLPNKYSLKQMLKEEHPPLRSIEWAGDPIIDACTVQADYGHLLLLTTSGTLHGVNLDTGTSAKLCIVDLPEIANSVNDDRFGIAGYTLHASSDGRYAAIVVDAGRNGIVVEIPSDAVKIGLNGGDYHEYTVPFSACFLCFEGRSVLVHRTQWNRLDVIDPASGVSLTERHIAPYTEAGRRPEHYLDYFHGQLRPSPDGTRIFDDGWVWQPFSIPRVWSVTDWLSSNPWESEDGASVVDLTVREDWTTPACWISERHIALWGLADWDEDECAETGEGSGVRIFDVTQTKQTSDGRWPMEMDAGRVLDLFSDGARIYVATDTGTTAWDLASRAQIASLPGFIAHLHDRVRHTLIATGSSIIVEFPLSALAGK
jgi:hypothetical protein